MTTIEINGVTFEVKFDTKLNTDRTESCFNFSEIYNIEIISVVDVGELSIQFMENYTEDESLLDSWNKYSESERETIILNTANERIGLLIDEIRQQLSEKI